jgi:hypothetical protein
MSKYDVSDFDADELNHAIDDTNFPHSHTTSASMSSANNGTNDENEGARRHTASSMPVPVKKNGHIAKSFSDDVFDVPGTPKTPRSIPTPGNCECL